jgi:hypothetical protein
LWLDFLQHEEESNKKNSSIIGEKRMLGEERELFYVNEKKFLGLFRRIPGFTCTSIL